MASAIRVMKANKALLNKRLNLFKRNGRFSEYRDAYRKASDGALEFKEVSKEELTRIRERIIRKKRRENVILTLILTPFIALVIWAMVVLFGSVKQSENKMVEESQLEDLDLAERGRKVFLASIKRGDQWFLQYKWQIAAREYKIALDIFPKDPVVLKKLGMVYTYGCINDGFACEKADSLIKELVISQPEDQEIQRMEALLNERAIDYLTD